MELTGRSRHCHLTYCLNIHAGESWSETFDAVRNYALAVRDRVCPGKPFGLGLRLSARAAADLVREPVLAEFVDFLERNRLYVFTINGFPYGRFHGTPVKSQVYAPDWRTPERLEYTRQLGWILSRLLPAGVSGSISTVPGTYRAWIRGPADRDAILLNLGRAALAFARFAGETGGRIRLALEPEPDCLWERTEEIVDFFGEALPGRIADLVYRTDGTSRGTVRDAVKEHLGICFDTCHQATQFERITPALDALNRAGVPIAKVQVSASPIAFRNTAEVRDCLAEFADPVYLHQVRARLPDGHVRGWPDLPEALDDLSTLPEACEIRTHAHIPLSIAEYGPLGSSRSEFDAEFFNMLFNGIAPHIEIETYTFSVLPASLRSQGVVSAVAGEFAWLLDQRPGEEGENGGGCRSPCKPR